MKAQFRSWWFFDTSLFLFNIKKNCLLLWILLLKSASRGIVLLHRLKRILAFDPLNSPRRSFLRCFETLMQLSLPRPKSNIETFVQDLSCLSPKLISQNHIITVINLELGNHLFSVWRLWDFWCNRKNRLLFFSFFIICFDAIRPYYFLILRLALFISALFLREWFTIEKMQFSKDFGSFSLSWRSLLYSTRFSLEFHQHSVTSLETHLSVKIGAYKGHGGFWMRNCCVRRFLKQKIFTNLSLCLIVEAINLIWWN